jgi:hypothetical protein
VKERVKNEIREVTKRFPLYPEMLG